MRTPNSRFSRDIIKVENGKQIFLFTEEFLKTSPVVKQILGEDKTIQARELVSKYNNGDTILMENAVHRNYLDLTIVVFATDKRTAYNIIDLWIEN